VIGLKKKAQRLLDPLGSANLVNTAWKEDDSTAIRLCCENGIINRNRIVSGSRPDRPKILNVKYLRHEFLLV